MKESIAFWYDSSNTPAEKPPKVELHFNLWRDLLVPDSNFFDVGIKFSKTERCDLSKAANSFSLFIPSRLEKDQLIDLSQLLHEQQTLNAIFNDVVLIRSVQQDYAEVEIGTEALLIHSINVTEEVEVEHVTMADEHIGTIFRFSTAVCHRLNGVKAHYLPDAMQT
jgi:hypothetical protein